MRTSAILLAATSAVLGSLVFSPQTLKAEKVGLEIDRIKAGRFEKVEFTIRVDGSYRNPFDPEEVELTLRITTPRGATLSLPAFWCQDYERQPIGGSKNTDWLYPLGQAGWKARFAPLEVGAYTAVAVCRDATGTTQSPPVRFEAAPSQRKGFVHVSKKDPRFLELDNGEPLFLIGQNLAFIGEEQYVNLPRAEAIFGKLAENGANFLRVWVCCQDWATAIEARKSAWGRSWEGKRPTVPLPGQENAPKAPQCLKLPEGKPLALNTCHPLAVRPEIRYVLSGKIRTDGGAKVRLVSSAPGLEATFTGQDGQWTVFRQEFTTGAQQRFLDRIMLQQQGTGVAWLDGLSLTEAKGGPELLGEADVNRPVRGYYNPTDCFVVDKLVEAAEKSGIYLQLCFITRDVYMDALKDPKSPEYRQAIRDGRKIVRYAAARWSYSPSVAVWEYFNENNPGLPSEQFYAELGKYFEQVDPCHRPRTTSAWGHSPKDWRHPQLDIAEAHHYLRPESKEGFKDEVDVLLNQIRYVQKNTPPNKPVLMAEFGLAENNWQRSPYMKEDKDLVHFHNILWTSALSGAAGTAQLWWWEQLDQQNAYRHYRPLAAFLADIPFTTAGLKEAAAKVSNKQARPIGLQGRDRAYLWLFNPEATWWNHVVEKTTPNEVRGATLEIEGLAPGAYRVQWWDTATGKVLKEDRATQATGPLKLGVPPFARDIACKVVR